MELMKINLLVGLGILFSSALISSCGEKNNPSETESKKIQAAVTVGDWKITKLEDSGNDETSHFSGYLFQFTDLGIINATKNGSTVSGTWSITSDDSGDDSAYDLDFNIFFSLTNEFEELNDDWEILTHSSTKIELIDVSGGNGGTDYLTFEKN